MQLVATVSTLREVFQNDVMLPVAVDDVMAALTELGLDRLEGEAPARASSLALDFQNPPSVETRLSLYHCWANGVCGGLYADWVQMSDAMFLHACEELGESIRCPLKIGFRNRLRSKTQAAMAPAQWPPSPQLTSLMGSSSHRRTGWPHDAAAVQPSTLQVGESMRQHMPLAPRSTAVHGEVRPYATSYSPPHSSGQRADARSGTGQTAPHAREAVATVELTAGSAKRVALALPIVRTVPVVAAAKASGTTCATTS